MDVRTQLHTHDQADDGRNNRARERNVYRWALDILEQISRDLFNTKRTITST